MTASDEPRRPFLRSRAALILAIALVLGIAVVVAVAIALGGQREPAASGTSSPAPVSPTPTAPDGSGSPSPSPAPDEPADAVENPIDEPAEIAGLEVAIASVEAVEGTANEPGEIGGPAIRVTVQFANGTDEPISLEETVVNVDSGADRTPAPELNAADGPGLPGSLPAGEQAEGVYVYTLPESERDDVRITVFTSVSAPEVVFSGSVPR